MFNRAKRRHADRFQQSGKAINDKVRLYSRIGRALLEAKQTGGDPFAAIETILPWEVFSESVTEAEKLAQPEDFDYLPLVGDGFNQLRRYTPALLEALTMKAAPAACAVMGAVEVLKDMNKRQARKVPDDAPTSFVRKRWKSLVHTPDGLDRRFYELCVLSELKNSLRSGDVWVTGLAPVQRLRGVPLNRSANFWRLNFRRFRSARICSAAGSSTMRHGRATSPTFAEKMNMLA